MIVSKLFARLGNQCFMCAAAIAHAKRMNTTYAFPRHSLDPRIWPTYFTLPIAKRATRHYYKEPRHAYDPLPLHDDMTIEGYFQSEKYFVDAKQEVAHALGFVRKESDYVAVHVRRGDYLLYPDQFPVLPLEYYALAIDACAGLYGFSKFRIYSDDIEWCKQNIKHGLVHYTRFDDIPSFEYSNIKDPLTDLRDMYNAAGFIIANSSYSLFAASLRDDNPMVIAPAESRWYGTANKHMETCDLMNENWIKI